MTDTERRRSARQRRDAAGPRHRFGEHGAAQLADVLLGLGLRLRWRRLVERHDNRAALGLLAMGNAVASIALIALAALATRQALVFPSLGPTAFLLIYRPHAIVSSPRNTVCGHLIGAASGLVALAVTGLFHQGAAPHHMTAVRVGAAAISLGLTTGGMIWLNVPHPPAAATTLIIGLGFLDDPAGVGVLMLGVLLLVAQGLIVNRLAGIDYPLWAPHPRLPAEIRRAQRLDREPRLDAYPEVTAVSYTVFVDATGDTLLTPSVTGRLRAALGDTDEFSAAEREWTAYVTVEAGDLLEAAAVVEDRVQEAVRAAGLTGWGFRCWEVRQIPRAYDVAPRRAYPRLPHRRAGVC